MLLIDGISKRIRELRHDAGELPRLRRRQIQLEGEADANRAALKHFQDNQEDFERRLRAYEAELGRYIPFDRHDVAS